MARLSIAPMLSALFLVGCASPRPEPNAPTSHHGGSPSPVSPAAGASEPFRALAIPAALVPGADRQVNVLFEAGHVKIVAIRLRNGVDLPEHATPVPAIIQAASGAGTVVLGAARVHIDPGKFVTLAPGVPHSVIPDPGADLVLLVHHLRGAAAVAQ